MLAHFASLLHNTCMKAPNNPFHHQTNWKAVLKWFGPSLVLAAIGFVIAYQFVEPAPPNEVTLAAGSGDGAYYTYALAYRHSLSLNNISVNVLETAGTIENLQLLESGDADIAFVQGGVAPGESRPGLQSIASLYFEPLWVFYRGDAIDRLPQLKGRRCAIGRDRSGTQALVLNLLEDNGINATNTTLLPLGGTAAAEALEMKDVDVAIFVASPTRNSFNGFSKRKVYHLSVSRARMRSRTGIVSSPGRSCTRASSTPQETCRLATIRC